MIRRRELLAAGGCGILAGSAAAGAIVGHARTVEPLDYRDVTLADGFARRQQATTLEALLAMDDDLLLRPFRQAAGLPVGEARLGGWYDWDPAFDPPKNLTGFIPGHSFGQYLSAMARADARDGDPRARAKIDRLIAGFAPTITPAFWRDYPLPAYTYDKLVIGLIDAHRFAGNRQALPLLDRVTDAVTPFLPGHAEDRLLNEKRPHRNPAWGWDETYTLPENLYLAANAGAGERYRQMARAYLLDETYFRPLAAGRNVLSGRHAYSHVNALASALAAFRDDGGPMHLAAARNGLGFVLAQSFATGGWGPNEGFVEPGSGKLGESLSSSHASFEAPCGSYGHFKVARALMEATGDSRWGDGMERLFYNAALGVLPLKPDGTAFYYADYNDAGQKTYYAAKCPCCSGTIGQLVADYGISAYLRDDAGLFVNLYTPSTATWRVGGVPALTLAQSGDYPLGDTVHMRVEGPRPAQMTLRLRIPAWAGPRTRLLVNGRTLPVQPGRFASITRHWSSGDRIVLRIERPLRLEAVDREHPQRVAAVKGPLALFRTGDLEAPVSREALGSLRQDEPGVAAWRLPGDAGRTSFRPYFALGTERARLYQPV